jgi:hypothetical protein
MRWIALLLIAAGAALSGPSEAAASRCDLDSSLAPKGQVRVVMTCKGMDVITMGLKSNLPLTSRNAKVRVRGGYTGDHFACETERTTLDCRGEVGNAGRIRLTFSVSGDRCKSRFKAGVFGGVDCPPRAKCVKKGLGGHAKVVRPPDGC